MNSVIDIKVGDARKLNIVSNSVDLVIAHPPYYNVIDYSNIMQLENFVIGNDLKSIDSQDISTSSLQQYMESMEKVFNEMYRVIKPGKYVVVIIGDNRKNGNIQPITSEFISYATKNLDFDLKDIFIWVTKGKAGMSVKRHGNHIDHNYILVFKKPS